MDPYNTADALNPRPQPAAAPLNPYAAPTARLAELHSDEVTRASRLSRLGAQLLDGLLVGGPLILVAVVTGVMQRPRQSISTGTSVAFALMGVWILGFAIYQLILLHRSGQTLGKKLVGIRIVRTDGSRAGLGRIFALRYLVPGLIGAIPFLGGFFSLADYLLIFGAEKRCIHDYIADTIVVDA